MKKECLGYRRHNQEKPLKKEANLIVQDCPYLLFKTSELETQWLSGQLSDPLQIKLLYAAYLHFNLTNDPLTITSLIRESKVYDQDSGIHATGRAGDASVKSFGDNAGMLDAWAAKLNRTFPYYGKPGAETCKIHDVGQGLHAHIQVGPNERLPKISTIEAQNA